MCYFHGAVAAFCPAMGLAPPQLIYLCIYCMYCMYVCIIKVITGSLEDAETTRESGEKISLFLQFKLGLLGSEKVF